MNSNILDRFILTVDKIKNDGDVPLLWKINSKDSEKIAKFLKVKPDDLFTGIDILGIQCDLTSNRSYCIGEYDIHSVLH